MAVLLAFCPIVGLEGEGRGWPSEEPSCTLALVCLCLAVLAGAGSSESGAYEIP